MQRHGIIVIGASRGGVDAVVRIVRDLPHDLSAALFVVIHLSPHHESLLPVILSGYGSLPSKHAADHETIHERMIYVAPSDRHMTLEPGLIQLNDDELEHFTRPAADPLFRSAAIAYGPEVVGIVLTGDGGDGAKGLAAIRAAGGITVVQDPADANHSSMPRNALRESSPDYCLPLNEIAALIVDLAHGRIAR